MITSKEKIQDMQIRENLLEVTEILLRTGNVEGAKETGAVAKQYGDRLKKPYTPGNTFDELWEKKVNAGCDREGIPRICPKSGDNPPLPPPVTYT